MLASGEEESGIEFFEKRIRPVLVGKCYECHSAASSELKGGLRLDSRAFSRKGGESGPAVVPASASGSLLLAAITDGEMPPDNRLSDSVIADFAKWIEIGAPDPRDQPPTLDEAAELSWQTILEKRRGWWSLQPVATINPPVGPEQPIDAFIRVSQRRAGIEPVKPAEARVLARRLSLVLTGLPPGTDEVENFVQKGNSDTDGAYEAMVDRLLDSPHFGEHWARHWLDVVRFAETHGYEWNHEIRDAWRYRDYLTRAFNIDIPYDQLVREHIAGDLLENPRMNDQLGLNESLIGTAFWRFGELGHDNCVDFPEIRFDALDNQIDTLSKAFQGLTVSCARCHDHKFDAISTKDYYALVGMLENCSQVVHTLDSPERIAKSVGEIRQLKVELRRQLGEIWLAAVNPMRDTILSALAGEQSLTGKPPDQPLDRENPAYVLKQFAKSNTPTFRSAKWIWVKPGANVNEPNVEPFHARFTFDLDATPGKATLSATADDRVTSYVNGSQLGVNESWKTPARYDVSKHLVKGRNTIAFEIANGTGPAGFLAAIEMDDKELGSSKEWKVTREPGDNWMALAFDDRAWEPASELGPAWMEPWSLVPRFNPQVEPRGDIALRWKTLAADYKVEHSRRERSFAEDFELWTDFRCSTAKDWMQSGLGLAEKPTRAGEFALALEGEQIVTAILPAGFHTNLICDRLNGSLRSPWIPLEQKFISLQLMGKRKSMVRTVVDSCSLNEFAGGGLEYLAGGEPKWKTFPTSATPNHRSFVELTTRSDNPRWPDRPGRAGSADPKEVYNYRSSFGVMRAVLHDTPAAPMSELAPILALFDQTAPTDECGIAAAFQGVARNAIADWMENRATDADVHWLNWMLRTGLLPNSFDDPELVERVQHYREMASAIPEPRVVAGLADQGGNRGFPVLQGGDPKRPLGMVPPRYLEVIAGTSELGSNGSGRLELAELIASPDNPLTARVMVNRVWHHLFGRGVVPTTDDFGRMGEEPTHPELLDFLSAEFVRKEWSIKRLIRQIVLSETFRQTSTPTDSATLHDPGNLLLHHYPVHRLDAEAIRDTILTVSGRLNPELFGPSLQPHRVKEVDYRKLFTGPLDGDGRRSLYIKITRMEGPQFLELFDLPDRMVTRGRRDRTNVPAQALAMLNDPFIIDQAYYWAEQLVASKHDSVDTRIRNMFQSAVGRLPNEREQKRFAKLIRSLAKNASDDAALLEDKSIWKDAAHAIFNMKELVYIR
ncbi:MAG: DUF1553 domain-containing protein [Verrucomicrobiota bacterium]|nr:DUF1553 domain-containing protein [Verrucomicrobiota bacterium]